MSSTGTYSPVLSPAQVAGINVARDTNVQNGIVANSGAGALPTTPVTPTTVINASNLTPQTPPVIPPVTTSTTANTTLGASLAGAAANMPTSPTTDTTDDTTQPSALDASRSSVLNTILGDSAQLGNEGADTAAADSQYGVDADTTAVTNLTNQYNAKSQYYDDLTQKAQQNNPLGLSADAIQENVDQISRNKNQELADIAVQQSAASGNLTAATALAKQAVDAKYEPLQAEINTLTSYYNLSGNDLTDEEKMQAQANITAKQDAVDQAAQKDLAAYNAQIQQSSPLYKAQVAAELRTANEPYSTSTTAQKTAQDNDIAAAVQDFQSQMQKNNWAGADPGAYQYYKDALSKEYGASAGLALDAAMKTEGITVTPATPKSKGGLFGTGLL